MAMNRTKIDLELVDWDETLRRLKLIFKEFLVELKENSKEIQTILKDSI
jgi:hypothetical protein